MYVVVEAKKQGAARLSTFFLELVCWEIPILSIKSDAGPMAVERYSNLTKTDWAEHKRLFMPFVNCVYVLNCGEEEKQAIEKLIAPWTGWSILATTGQTNVQPDSQRTRAHS